MIKVRVSERGGVFKEIEIPDDSTVETALRIAGARLDVSKEIRINNETVELDDIVENLDTIIVIPQTKGNK